MKILLNFVIYVMVIAMTALLTLPVLLGALLAILPGGVGKFGYNLLLGLDQFGNILLLGSSDETISSRLGRAQGKEKYMIVKVLRTFVDDMARLIAKQEAHCKDAIEPDFNTRYEIWNWIKEEKCSNIIVLREKK